MDLILKLGLALIRNIEFAVHSVYQQTKAPLLLRHSEKRELSHCLGILKEADTNQRQMQNMANVLNYFIAFVFVSVISNI